MTDLVSDESCGYSYTDLSTSSLEEPWDCPHEAVAGREVCVFHLTAHEREEAGISKRDVERQFTAALESGDPDRRAFVGGTLPTLDFDYVDFDHDDQHMLDLRHACLRGDFVANSARFEEAIDLRDATVHAFRAREAKFGDGLLCERTTFEEAVDCYNGTVAGDDAVFTDATFEGTVNFDQATVSRAAAFDGATFADEATFRGAEFHGRSINVDDYTSFDGATFAEDARFAYAQFEAVSFESTSFGDAADFEETVTTAPAAFDGATFESVATFDGATFEDDVSYVGATFDGETRFRGVTFDGGGTVLHADADFSEATFAKAVSFESGRMGAVRFDEGHFEAEACYRDVSFRERASFAATTFAGEAVFDEATFDGEATFEGVTFESSASYPGVDFRGSNTHEGVSVTFDGVTFEGDANFHHVWCRSASFRTVQFEDAACFAESTFTTRIDVQVDLAGSDTILDFTDADLASGAIVQPDDGRVRCDLTTATIGEVRFRTGESDERDLFRYLRFCETTFEGFDFTAHAHYLTQVDWRLHEFDEGDCDHEYAVEMTPLAIEKTYQRAKTNASAEGNVEASGKFRFKRQQYARRNFRNIARDPDEPIGTRVRNGLRVGENFFLGLTCGHGMRLYRITAMFLFFPILPALLYAFGGPRFRTEAGQVTSVTELATMGGLETFVANIHFSYITFLTIGYGNVVAEGSLGLVLVSLEVYAGVILGGLLIYVLVKRSEL